MWGRPTGEDQARGTAGARGTAARGRACDGQTDASSDSLTAVAFTALDGSPRPSETRRGVHGDRVRCNGRFSVLAATSCAPPQSTHILDTHIFRRRGPLLCSTRYLCARPIRMYELWCALQIQRLRGSGGQTTLWFMAIAADDSAQPCRQLSDCPRAVQRANSMFEEYASMGTTLCCLVTVTFAGSALRYEGLTLLHASTL